jgi:hypothetical protein
MTPHDPPALAAAFADALQRFKEADGDMQDILASPGLEQIRREARPWRRFIDRALGCEPHTTADETAARLHALAELAAGVPAGAGRG